MNERGTTQTMRIKNSDWKLLKDAGEGNLQKGLEKVIDIYMRMHPELCKEFPELCKIDIPACKCGLSMVKFFTNVDDIVEELGTLVIKDYPKELEAAMIKSTEIMEDSLREMEKYCGLDTKEAIEQVKAIKKIFKESVGYSFDFKEIIDILKKISNNLNPQLSKCR